jgi:hypothetical protein
MGLPGRIRFVPPEPQDSSLRAFIHLDEAAIASGSLKRLKFLHGPSLLLDADLHLTPTGAFSEEFPGGKTRRQLPNFRSERSSTGRVRPGMGDSFNWWCSCDPPVAFAEVLERAAPQMLDGQSQSKLLATICYGFRLAIICQWRMRRTKRHRILQPAAMRIATFGCGHGCPLLSGRGKLRLALRTGREVSLASKKVAQFQGAIPFRAQLHPRA